LGQSYKIWICNFWHVELFFLTVRLKLSRVNHV
jgi:hypothetical protein